MDADQRTTGPAKILIVDDIEVNVKILDNIMTKGGYDTLCALNVQDALEIMGGTLPQLILSDYSMPGMNGLEFCRLLKSNPVTRDIPFIFITVADSSEEKRQAFEAGVVDFISKPFEPVEVIMRVNNQINSYHIKQELENYNRLMHKMVTEQKKQMDKERENMLQALGKVVERRSTYTERHFERIGYNSHLLAQGLQLIPRYEQDVTDEFVDTIGTVARLHDIGNILMPDEMYFKEYDTEEEKYEETVKFHTEEGAEILEEISAGSTSHFLNMAISIARYHHARWDGNGYPKGVGGDDIPLAARITTVVSDFDSLISKGGDQQKQSVEECVEIMNKGSATIYDPNIMEVFNKVVRQMQCD